MPETIPNLWPPEFKVDVQTPYTILRVQANLLGKVTRGILEGTVETETSKEREQHRLVVVAPAYNGYRHTLITAIHSRDMPYPAEVRAEALAETVKDKYSMFSGSILGYKTVYPSANSDDEMQALVQRTLNSGQTKAAILSLIAKSNEARLSATSAPQVNADDANRGGQAPPQEDSEDSQDPNQ